MWNRIQVSGALTRARNPDSNIPRNMLLVRKLVVRRVCLATVLLGLGVSVGCDGGQSPESRARFRNDSEEPCVFHCREDIVPKQVDCARAEEGLEFLVIGDFDGGVVSNFYQYDDRSPEFRSPPNGWEPPAEQIPRCVGDDENFAFHLQGGPFMAWGGGFGSAVGRQGDLQGKCMREDKDCHEGVDPQFVGSVLNLSEWEGISFWGRRGPDGQPGIRIGVTDKYIDDDLAFLDFQATRETRKPPMCRRWRECGCLTQSCTYFADEEGDGSLEGYYCYEPDKDPSPRDMANAVDGEDPYRTQQHRRCGQTACDEPYPAFPDDTDYEFSGKPCTEHEFAGGIRDSYCFDPEEDPPPPNPNELCGDFWVGVVHLTPEWRFYKVPFTDMLQQGWAMEGPLLDLTSISQIRFTYGNGWIDYWIDDVAFYRKERD